VDESEPALNLIVIFLNLLQMLLGDRESMTARIFFLATVAATLSTNALAQSAVTARNSSTIAFRIPSVSAGHYGTDNPEILLHDFSFDGKPVSATSLHIRTIRQGVYELTSDADAIGEWKFGVDDAADGYYGLGERFDTLNHTHQIVMNASQDNAATKGNGTYKPIPFYMSTTGYGLWLDTTSEAAFDMNDRSRDTVFISEPAKQLRIVLFAGPRFTDILDHFTEQAGRSMLPPYWSFAPWISRDAHENQAAVEGDLARTRSLGLPASVVLIDSPWATGYNSYTFNPKQFDDAAAMVKNIHQSGFKLVLWHTSWINNKTKAPGEKGFAGKIAVKSSNYDEAATNGYFLKDPTGKPYIGTWWKGEGSLIDFTNPQAKAWWEGEVTKIVKQGADGFKDDDAEGNFQGDVSFADGTDKRLMRNRYAVQYNHAVEDVIQKELKGNGILFMRSATVGNHNLAMLWGGDNESSFSPENGLPTAVTSALNAGISGMALYAADNGGYLGTSTTPDPKVFMRWTQYAALSPVMETINTKNVNPWDYGDAALQNYKKYVVLHMSLFPYRYAAAQEAAKNGMPITRALVLNYQDDKQARESKDEYLLGPDLLVAPVIDQNLSRVVYLPKGEWTNYWTGERLTGGQTIIAQAAMDVLPLYVRSGAIIPKIPEDTMTLVPSAESGNTSVKSLDDRRIYELYPGESAGAVTDFEGRTLTRSAGGLQIAGKAAKVTVRWRFVQPRDITVNGKPAKAGKDSFGAFVTLDHASATTIAWK
jgi:alpha-D-xyloside xylohydrolase